MQIQTVVGWREPGGVCGTRQLGVNLRFQPVIQMDVLQRATSQAHQVMVVIDQRFGQLEMSVIGATGDTGDDTATFEHFEIAVGGALWQFGGVVGDLGECHRSGDSGQCFDQVTSATGVAVIVAFQLSSHRLVEFDHLATVGVAGRNRGRGADGAAGCCTHGVQPIVVDSGVNETHSQ